MIDAGNGSLRCFMVLNVDRLLQSIHQYGLDILQVTNNYTSKRLCINSRVVTIENKQICIKWKVRVSAYRIHCVNARLSLSSSFPSFGGDNRRKYTHLPLSFLPALALCSRFEVVEEHSKYRFLKRCSITYSLLFCNCCNTCGFSLKLPESSNASSCVFDFVKGLHKPY